MKATHPHEQGKSLICTVDSFANGISFGRHEEEKDGDPSDRFFLRIPTSANFGKLQSRFAMNQEGFFYELEGCRCHGGCHVVPVYLLNHSV